MVVRTVTRRELPQIRLAFLALSLALPPGCSRPPAAAATQSPAPIAPEPQYAPSANPPLSAPLPPAQVMAGIPYPRFAIPRHPDRPELGPTNAPVTIEIFSDFECPYCAQAQRNLDELNRRFPNQIRRVYRAFPLSRHSNAMLAALIAESAQAQGKFWPFYRTLFSAGRLSKDKLMALAAQQGLDLSLLEQELASLTHASKVQRDLALAEQFAVRATPIFFVNGRRVEGSASLPLLSHYVEQEQRVVAALSPDKTPIYERLTRHGYVGPKPQGTQAPTRVELPTDGAPARGPEDAAVTIVTFTDFECPYCVKGDAQLRQALAAYPDQVRLVFRHMPLPFHAQGKKAARIAVLAQEQGKFWAFYDALFAHQGPLDDDSLTQIAQRIGLTSAQVQEALVDAEGRFDQVVQRDIDLARALGVRGTPAYFINGVAKRGMQSELSLRLDIAKELQRNNSQ